MKSPSPSRALLLASIGLYLACLTQNAFCLETGRSLDCSNIGWAVVLLGWLETLLIADVGPFVALPWFANPLLAIAWGLVSSKRRAAVVLAGLGTALALSFLLADSLQISEGGGPSRITSHGPGYWLWLGSMAMALLSAVLSPGGRRPDSRPG